MIWAISRFYHDFFIDQDWFKNRHNSPELIGPYINWPQLFDSYYYSVPIIGPELIALKDPTPTTMYTG